MSIRTARLHLGVPPADSRIEVNGRELEGVTALWVKANAQGIPTLELELGAYEIEIDGEMQTVIPGRTRETLIALGWTPPTDD